MPSWSKVLWRLRGICGMGPDERNQKLDHDYSPAALVKATQKKAFNFPILLCSSSAPPVTNVAGWGYPSNTYRWLQLANPCTTRYLIHHR